MKLRSVAPMRIAKYGYIVMSIAFCVIGLLLVLFPEVSTAVIYRVLGIALLCFGVIKLIGYFSRDLFRLAFQFDLEFGILLLALGLLVLVRPVGAMSFLCIALGIAILADGLFKLRIAADARTFGVRPWWLLFTLAILTAVVGLLLIFRPRESAVFLTALLGVSLLTEGILNLCVVISTVKIIRHQQPDVIDAETCDEE
ncbi:MAG: DUF308 domain-containing protein [Firmicutes bacterium]|nr:DUF308 domain-containing protein [Bacillota bacterium]